MIQSRVQNLQNNMVQQKVINPKRSPCCREHVLDSHKTYGNLFETGQKKINFCIIQSFRTVHFNNTFTEKK